MESFFIRLGLRLEELATLVLEGQQTRARAAGIDANAPIETQRLMQFQEALAATRTIGRRSDPLAKSFKIGG